MSHPARARTIGPIFGSLLGSLFGSLLGLLLSCVPACAVTDPGGGPGRIDASGGGGDGDGGGGEFDPDGGAGMLPDADPGLRGWQAMGAALPSAYPFASLGIAIGGDGQPVIVFMNQSDTALGADVYRFDGAAWQQVGARIDTMNYQTAVNLAASGSRIVVGFPYGGRNEIREWNGGAWLIPVGTPLATMDTTLPHTSIAMDATGEPWVAYSQGPDPVFNNPLDVYVSARAAGAWSLRGAALSENVGAQPSALAPHLAAGGGEMWIQWEENGIHARRWDAATSSWFALGGGRIDPPASAGVQFPSTGGIAVGPDGRAVVGYHAYVGSTEGVVVFVAREDGALWTHVGQSLQASPGADGAGQPSSAIFQSVAAGPGGVIYVAWGEATASATSAVYVYRCQPPSGGCAPVGRGRLDVDPGVLGAARLAVDGAGRPVVAWMEYLSGDSGPLMLHVWRYFGDPDGV